METTGGATLEQLKQLAAPFEAHEISTKPGGGRSDRWVEAPVLMARLNRVVGPENWRDSYQEWHNDRGVVCLIEIFVEGRGWVGKSHGGAYQPWTQTTKKGEVIDQAAKAFKAGFTDAFRRAALKWGMAIDLYAKTKLASPDRPPAPRADRPAGLPSAADHPRNRERDRQADAAPPPAHDYDGPDRPPATGSQLCAWAKKHGVMDWVVAWGERHGTKKRVVDWSPEAAERAFRAFQEEHDEALAN